MTPSENLTQRGPAMRLPAEQRHPVFSHRAWLAARTAVLAGVAEASHPVVLTGSSGIGKSALLADLSTALREAGTKVAMYRPGGGRREDLPGAGRREGAGEADAPTVLLIDDAERLDGGSLAQLAGRTCVLVGKPDFAARVAAEMDAATVRLDGVAPDEVAAYLRTALAQPGQPLLPMMPAAIGLLNVETAGVPRLLTAVGRTATYVAKYAGAATVDPDHVRSALDLRATLRLQTPMVAGPPASLPPADGAVPVPAPAARPLSDKPVADQAPPAGPAKPAVPAAAPAPVRQAEVLPPSAPAPAARPGSDRPVADQVPPAGPAKPAVPVAAAAPVRPAEVVAPPPVPAARPAPPVLDKPVADQGPPAGPAKPAVPVVAAAPVRPAEVVAPPPVPAARPAPPVVDKPVADQAPPAGPAKPAVPVAAASSVRPAEGVPPPALAPAARSVPDKPVADQAPPAASAKPAVPAPVAVPVRPAELVPPPPPAPQAARPAPNKPVADQAPPAGPAIPKVQAAAAAPVHPAKGATPSPAPASTAAERRPSDPPVRVQAESNPTAPRRPVPAASAHDGLEDGAAVGPGVRVRRTHPIAILPPALLGLAAAVFAIWTLILSERDDGPGAVPPEPPSATASVSGSAATQAPPMAPQQQDLPVAPAPLPPPDRESAAGVSPAAPALQVSPPPVAATVPRPAPSPVVSVVPQPAPPPIVAAVRPPTPPPVVAVAPPPAPPPVVAAVPPPAPPPVVASAPPPAPPPVVAAVSPPAPPPSASSQARVAVLPPVPGPATPPMARLDVSVLPVGASTFVEFRYPAGNAEARQHADALAQSLRAGGLLVGKPQEVAAGRPKPGIGYFYAEDEDAAAAVGTALDRLGPGLPGPPTRLAMPVKPLPRPGMVIVTLGSK